jgi:hypothetical protein
MALVDWLKVRYAQGVVCFWACMFEMVGVAG